MYDRIPIDDLPSTDFEDRDELIEVAQEAKDFLLWHDWCDDIIEGYFDRGFAKIAVFWFRIVPARNAPDTHWVIVGDLPPAYISTEDCPNGATALDGYIGELIAWVEAAENQEPLDKLMPVRCRGSLELLEPSAEIIDIIKGRITFIGDKLLPMWESELDA